MGQDDFELKPLGQTRTGNLHYMESGGRELSTALLSWLFLSPQISITAPTTLHARMGQRAPTVGSGATPAPVAQATLAWTVNWNSASVTATPVAMEAAVR